MSSASTSTQAKIDLLDSGGIPILRAEPGRTRRPQRPAERLRFTTDAAAGDAHTATIFIAVGTPPDEDGSADLQYVLAVGAQYRRAHADR